jgi:phytoene dehydrogenase-like protein
MGAVADAIHRSALSLGATVRTDAPVVVTAIHPRITFLE